MFETFQSAFYLFFDNRLHQVTFLWVTYPGYQSQKIIKRKNKEGKNVGSGQMVTSIVGIDQLEAYIPDRVYRLCEI